MADIIQVGSPNAGRIVSINLEVGDPVVEGQLIATVEIPVVISRSETTDTSKIGFRDVQDQRAQILSPRSGVIAANWVRKDDIVAAGQPIVTLADLRKVWIEADVEQKKMGRVGPGSLVEVEIPGRDGTLTGMVDAVSPVISATLSSAIVPNSSNNSSKVAQVVPVKITLDGNHLSLTPGSEAKVKIWIR